MKMIAKYNGLIALTILGAALLAACTVDEPETVQGSKGVRAYAEVTLNHRVSVETRMVQNTYDGWSVSTFNDPEEDIAGIFITKGKQNPENLEDFSLPITNGVMKYEGTTGTNSFRFGNSEYVLDPTTVGGNYSMMYYPYYEDMPDPWINDPLPGLPLRKTSGGIEKCIDYMCTNVAGYTSIKVSNNVLNPSFYHYFVNLIVQRGKDFDDPKTCDKIWIVMEKPCTDIRIRQNSSTGIYYQKLQYTPDAGKTEEELTIDLMQDVVKPADDFFDQYNDPKASFKVNKYAVWETWQGSPYQGKTSQYAIIPPGIGYALDTNSNSYVNSDCGKIYFILIQDNDGHWQRVSDFYLYSSTSSLRYGESGKRYVLTIQREGVNVVARPSLVSWDEELEVTYNHKNGIHDYQQYKAWAGDYNRYITEGRPESMRETLKQYGDGETVTGSDYTSWKFYINDDIAFPNNGEDFAVINQLDDQLEGTSTYRTYSISNIHGPLINTIGEKGVLKALDFPNVRLKQEGEAEVFANAPYGAVTRVLDGGTIDQCNVIEGVLVTPNEVGMVAGKVTEKGGTVKNCIVSGNVFGKSTAAGYNGLFGTVEEGQGAETDGTTFKGLRFTQN